VSRENVEIVRRVNEAFSRGDVPAILALTDPDCEWWDRADDPDADIHRGQDALVKYLADIYDMSTWHVELEDCIDVGDVVVVSAHVTGRGRASGAAFDTRQGQTYRLRDGKITEFREYREISEALKAVGLEE
jgi:ketosteroid isomerase-like protein